MSPDSGEWGSTFRYSQYKRFAYDISLGYQVYRWLGIDGSFHRVSLDREQGGPLALNNAQWVQLGVNFHFGRR